MRQDATEHQTQTAILEYLAYRRVFHWRNNTGAMVSEYKGKHRFLRFGVKGSPDIFSVVGGRIIGIEVKGPKGKLSEAQEEFRRELEKAGGIYVVARDVKDAQVVVEWALRMKHFWEKPTYAA